MDIHRMFNRTLDQKDLQLDRLVAPGRDAGAPDGETPVTGAFITAESLTSFAGATGAISVIWSTVTLLVPGASVFSTWIGFAISVVVGMIIYWINITDPQAPLSDRQKKIGLVVAVLNTLVLFTASFGVTQALGR